MSKHWSPQKNAEVEGYDDMPKFVRRAPARRVGGVGRFRGRDGIDEIAQLVGSKRFRDIKRSGNFMPGQFQLWNDNEKGGNGKYWGGYQDADGDGLAHEFVVRRGDETGPLIAVNGYTTKQSDWGARRLFYEKYPTRKERKKKTARTFMRNEYYVPDYAGGMDVKSWTIEPGSAQDDLREWTMYNNYRPKSMSPYQAVNKYIVQPALELYLNKQGIDKKTYLENNGGVGALSRLASAIYDHFVRNQVIGYLRNTGEYDVFESIYKTNHSDNDPDYEIKLEKYIFNRKDVKEYIKQYVTNNILNDETRNNSIQYYAANIKGDELKSPPRPKPVTPKQPRRMVKTPTSPPRFPSDISEDEGSLL